MAKLKLQIDNGEVVEVRGSVKVIYELDEDESTNGDTEQLHVKYTDEGRVTDLIDDVTNDVNGTKWETVDDLVEDVP